MGAWGGVKRIFASGNSLRTLLELKERHVLKSIELHKSYSE